MSNATLMVDLSSNNPLPDLKAHYKAGYRVIALKATEGTSYTWSEHCRLADQWHKLGGSVWHYHFARPGNAAAQATRFVSLVGTCWKAGDRIVLDVETAGVDAGFVRDFIGECHARVPTWRGVVYSYASFLTSNKIKPSHGWGLWLAAYGSVKPKPVAGWNQIDAWQYSDKVIGVPGMKAPVDQSRLYLVDAPEPTPTAPELTPLQRRRIRRAIRTLRAVLGKGKP